MIQKQVKEVIVQSGTIAYPVSDKVNMLIRQVRSFGSLSKELVSMLLTFGEEKPEGSFRAPTYFIGGSNVSLHGRVGLFLMRLVVAPLTPFGGFIHTRFTIESRRQIGNIKSSAPPKVLSPS